MRFGGRTRWATICTKVPRESYPNWLAKCLPWSSGGTNHAARKRIDDTFSGGKERKGAERRHLSSQFNPFSTYRTLALARPFSWDTWPRKDDHLASEALRKHTGSTHEALYLLLLPTDGSHEENAFTEPTATVALTRHSTCQLMARMRKMLLRNLLRR